MDNWDISFFKVEMCYLTQANDCQSMTMYITRQGCQTVFSICCLMLDKLTLK